MDETHRHADYDQIAPTYDRRYERNSYAGVESALLEFVGNPTDLQILEVGCGTGHWLEILQARGTRPTGLDFSAGMLNQARRRMPAVPLVQGTAQRLPWATESFGRVFCVNAIHHFTDKPAFLAEARRLLRPAGMILIVGLDPRRGVDRWFVYDYFPESLEIDRRRFPSSIALRTGMQAAGFKNCVTQELEHWIYRLPAQEILRQGRLDKAATSQLSVLTQAEYRRGLDQIRTDMQRAEAAGGILFLSADLRLYGTMASRAG